MTKTIPRYIKRMIDNDIGKGEDHPAYTRVDDKTVLIEEYKPTWDKIAEIFLSSVPINQLEDEANRRGILNPSTGKPFGEGMLVYFIYTPVTWGHRAHNVAHIVKGSGKKQQRWLYEPQYADEVPDDVYIRYNLHEPVWSGTLGRQVLDEIYHRQGKMGRGAGINANLFTNVFVCGQCGRVMSSISSEGAIRCRTYYRRNDAYYQQEGVESLPECEPGIKITYEDAIDWLTPRLEMALKYHDLSILTVAENHSDYVLDELNKRGVSGLWHMDALEANKLLRAALGHKRLVVLNNEIVGVVE